MKRLLGMGMLLALVLVHGTPAEAHIKKWRSSVTANEASEGGDHVTYTIATSKAKCIPNRTVRLLDSTGAIIATNTNGVTANSKIGSAPNDIVAGEEYRINIKKKVIKRKSGHRHICKAATSAAITAVA